MLRLKWLGLSIISLVFFLGLLRFPLYSAAQTPTDFLTTIDCIRVQDYMDVGIAPDKLIQGGGVIVPDEPVSASITELDAGDRWIIGAQGGTEITLSLQADIPLRLRLYQNMSLLRDIVMEVGSPAREIPIPFNGLYSLTITREDILDKAIVGTYTLAVGGAAQIIEANQLVTVLSDDSRFIFYNRLISPQQNADIHLNGLIAEQVTISLDGGEIFTTPIDGATQATLSTSGYHIIEVENGAGGSFTLTTPNTNSSRLATLEPFQSPRWESYPDAPEVNLQDGIAEFTMQDGAKIRTAPDTFSSVSPIPLFYFAEREFSFRFGRGSANEISFLDGNLSITHHDNADFIFVEQFDWRGQFLDDSNFQNFRMNTGEVVRLNWDEAEKLWILPNCIGIELTGDRRIIAEVENLTARQTESNGFIIEASTPETVYDVSVAWVGLNQVIFEGQRIKMQFEGNRLFQTDRLLLNLNRITDENGRTTQIIEFDDEPFVRTDWENINSITIENNETSIHVQDGRGEIRRNERPVQTLETSEQVIRIRWQEGSESLLLPESEDFIQIDTPAEPPGYNPLATPGVQGFLPAGLNNTGLECSQVNTALNFNCTENGLVNPANGNLAYSVTDLFLPNYARDLTLTRTYNSLNATIDGPFGFGWSTDYVLHPEAASYQLALDLTQAPRGQVVFTTPSGSRHLFTTENSGEAFVSNTLPGWQIAARIDELGSDWKVYRSDGLAYIFDRAGRLKEIDYPYKGGLKITRLANSPAAVYELKDSLTGQYLLLEFDSREHIIRSAIYDVDASLLAETLYTYDEKGRLTSVQYPDSTQATYEYDEGNNLISHADWRAPLSRILYYTYDNNHRVQQISLEPSSTPTPNTVVELPYRQYAYRPVENVLTTTVTNEWGATETWQYEITFDPSTAYRLSATSVADEAMIFYRYGSDGVLNQIRYPTYNQEFALSDSGFPTAISNQNGFIGFNAAYTLIPVNGYTISALASYSDNPKSGLTQATYEYDENGLLFRYQDENGLLTTIVERDPIFGLPSLLELTGSSGVEQVRFVYDERGYPIQRTDSRGTYQLEWDRLGRLISYIDPLSRKHSIEYRFDSETVLGQCMVITDPIAVQTSYCYNARQKLADMEVRETDGTLLQKTSYLYDEIDRLIEIQQLVDESSLLITTYQYRQSNTLGNWVLETTDPYGRTERVEYDALNRVVNSLDVLGRITSYRYEVGRNDTATQVTQTSPTGLETQYAYNIANQLCSYGSGDVVYQLAYASGCNIPQRNITRLSIGSFLSVSFENYDAAGRPGSIAFVVDRPIDSDPTVLDEPESFNFGYVYDEYGHLTQYEIRQGTNRQPIETTAFNYTILENGSQEITVSRAANGSQQNLHYTYDAIDRLIQVATPNDSAVREYRYTDLPNDNLLEVLVRFSDDSGNIQEWTMWYDGLGNLRQWKDHDQKLITYIYDALSRLREVRANGKLLTGYTYNELNQVLTVRNQYGQVYRYVYNDLGLLTTKRDFNDIVTVYTYDQFGNLSSITDALGYRVSYLYDRQNRVTSITGASGREITFDWRNANTGQLTYTSGDHILHYYFDLIGRLWQIQEETLDQQDRRIFENRHYLRYDIAGRVVGFWPYAENSFYNDQFATLFGYGTDNTLIAIDGARNNTQRNDETLRWDWQFRYDDFSRLISRTDPNGFPISLEYDSLGRFLGILLSEAYERNYTYTPQSITMNNGTITSQISYDEFYRLISETSFADTPLTTTYQYTDSGNFLVTDPFGAQKLYIYPQATDVDQPYFLIVRDIGIGAATIDDLNVDAEQTSGRQFRYIMNSRGELIGIQRDEIFEGEPTRYRIEEQVSYDPSGRPIRYVDAQNNPFTFAYDTQGNLITFQTPDGVSSFYSYDALNQLTEIRNSGNQVIQLEYDPQGQVENITLNGEQVGEFRYDIHGNLIERRFEQGVIRYEYDAADNITQWTNADGTAITITRSTDAFARPINIDGSQFEYDANGTVISASNQEIGYRFAIDPIGRLIQVTEDETREWHYTYGNDGRSYTLVIGDDPNHLLNVEVGNDLRLNNISTSSNSMVINYVVRADENVIQAEISWGDGFETQVRFNRLGQIIRVVHNRDQIDFSTLIFDYELNYLGLPQAISEPEYDIFVGYDSAYRPAITRWLYTGIEAKESQDSIQYAFTITYDSFGNRASELILNKDGSQQFFEYGIASNTRTRNETTSAAEGYLLLLGLGGLVALKQRNPRIILILIISLLPLLSLSGSHAQQSQPLSGHWFAYEDDENGNLAKITENLNGVQHTRSFTYDAYGRLTAINSSSLGDSKFSYDAFGRLVSWNTHNFGTFEYRYDGDRLIEITTADGQQIIATPSNAPLLLADNGTPHWALYDGLQNLRLTFDEHYSASSADSFQQDIFGNPLPQLNNAPFPPDNPFAFEIPFFQGMLYDPDNGIYIRLDGRAYDPTTGRYLQRNMLGLDANGDLYAYKQERFALPVLPRETYPFFEGIQALNQVSPDVLYAENILQSHLPEMSLAWQDTGLAALNNYNQAGFSQQMQYAELPAWLGYAYNPAGVIAAQGGFRLLEAGMQPWNATTPFPNPIPSVPAMWSPTQIHDLFITDITPPTWDAPDGWRANQFWEWPTEMPQPVRGVRSPSEVENYLVYPFANLTHYQKLMIALENLPTDNAGSWLAAIDAATLPSTPEVLPETMETWLGQWFTYDTIPVWNDLREIYSSPEAPASNVPSLSLDD